MIPRFFIPVPPQGDLVTITGQEAHHILNVRRLRPGDSILLFDPSGVEYTALIQETGRKAVLVQITGKAVAHREPAVKITLAAAIPKGERADFLVQKCAELGCHTWIPTECERSVVRIVAGREGKIQRWRRIALEASKQCGRTHIMNIAEPRPFSDVIAAANPLRILCAPGPEAKPLKILLAETNHPKDIMCLVGPEGGFTDAEVCAARAAGLRLGVLARSILRTETAAIVSVAVIAAEYLSS